MTSDETPTGDSPEPSDSPKPTPMPGKPRPMPRPHQQAQAPLLPPVSDPRRFGRVADDGTVYLITAAGERVVGSWQAGETEAAYAHFGRRFDDLATEVQNAAVAPRGQVRLTAPLSFGTIRLAPLLARFAADYPDIGLDVQFTDRIVNLVDEGFDAAIRVGTPTDAALTGRRLCSAQVIVVAAPAYLDRHGTPESPAQLRGHRCIIDTNFRDPHQWQFRGGLRVPVAIDERASVQTSYPGFFEELERLREAIVPPR